MSWLSKTVKKVTHSITNPKQLIPGYRAYRLAKDIGNGWNSFHEKNPNASVGTIAGLAAGALLTIATGGTAAPLVMAGMAAGGAAGGASGAMADSQMREAQRQAEEANDAMLRAASMQTPEFKEQTATNFSELTKRRRGIASTILSRGSSSSSKTTTA